MQIDDEMIKNIQDDMQALDPDGARREYERIEHWNEYQRRYRAGVHKRPNDDASSRNNKKNKEA